MFSSSLLLGVLLTCLLTCVLGQVHWLGRSLLCQDAITITFLRLLLFWHFQPQGWFFIPGIRYPINPLSLWFIQSFPP